MAYDPSNNPYVPGDPYAYDLKWVVEQIKGWKDPADSADRAKASEDAAKASELNSEAWAVGTKDGEPVDPAEPQHDNNSKFWAGEAADSAGEAADSAAEAKDYADHIADPVAGLVTNWLNDHITQPTTPAIDTSLTVAGAAADAKAAGDAIMQAIRAHAMMIRDPQLDATNNDLDVLPVNTIFSYYLTSGTVANIPSGATAKHFTVITYSGTTAQDYGSVQLLYDDFDSCVYIRYSFSGYHSWQKLIRKADIDAIPMLLSLNDLIIDSEFSGAIQDCDLMDANRVYIYYLTSNTLANAPGDGKRLTIFTPSGYNNSVQTQIALAYDTDKVYMRHNKVGTWTSWTEIVWKEELKNTNNFRKVFNIIAKPSDFSGKAITAFGDSITYGAVPGQTPNYVTPYIERFATIAGATIDNQAQSGTYICDNDPNSITNKILNYAGSPEAIFIAGGVNDWYYGKPLGSFGDQTISTFYGALYLICEKLANDFRSAKAYFITPINSSKDPATAVDTIDAYRSAIYEMAAIYGFNVIDGSIIGFRSEQNDFMNTVMPDGLHPNGLGHQLYANTLSGLLL